MKMTKRVFITAVILLVVFFSYATYWAVKNLTLPGASSGENSTYGSQTVLGKITAITEEGQITLTDHPQLYQVMNVTVEKGDYAGQTFSVTYGKTQVRSDETRFKVGDQVYIMIGQGPDGSLKATYTDFDRTGVLLLLLFVFVLAVLAMGRWKGFGSLVSLCFSMFIILAYIIPHVLAGDDPVQVSLIGSGILLGVSLYMTYGWNLKTHASVISMVITLLITGLLTALFVDMAHLTGYGDENALYLIQLSSVQINPQGLLLGGMIIGTLGILDDLVTSQSAAVVEIHGANPTLNFKQTFLRAIHIGQDHVAATVNTLVLSYTGASLPLLLVFTLAQGSFQYLVNTEMLAEEIVRTLVGSLGLVAAVPISTLVATFIITKQDSLNRLGPWRTLLGPETSDSAEGHHVH
ncbi:MAG: YibE/F family protein [Anaerolineaceae bacterium]|nr:YibE/F family protein [Anaerolineaceae bacterium]